ncbi:hypothetical protein BGZ94_003139 [Podila epigama]|nr:hypothetical protein BGZ94_003139 [Podila epigama]
MKFFSAIVAASALASAVTAQTIAISNPTVGSTWYIGKPSYISWTGNCNSLGSGASNVTVQLVNGPSNAVQYVTDVGTLDCSGRAFSVNNAVIPESAGVTPGTYSIRVMTSPEPSYSPAFTVADASKPAPPPATGTNPPAPTQTGNGNSASRLASGSLAVVLGAAALQLL